MRKLITNLIIFFAAGFFLFSCKFVLPEKLTVKGRPVITAPFGKADIDINEKFDAGKFASLLKDLPNAKIYEYAPAGNTDEYRHILAAFSIKKDITGLEVDKYMKKLQDKDPIAFGYEADGKTPKPLFTAPAINLSPAINPIDFKDKVDILNSVAFSPIIFSALAETGGPESTAVRTVNMTLGTNFKTISFQANSKFTIPFAVTGGSASAYTLKITDAEIFKDDGISSITKAANLPLDITATGTVIFDLSGKTLPDKVKIKFTLTSSGGILGQNRTASGTPALKDAKLSYATGINLADQELDLPMQIVSLEEAANMLKGAVIGEGVFTTGVNIPAGIKSGITSVFELNISQNDFVHGADTYQGIKINETLPGTGGTVSLNGKNINGQSISVGGKYKATVNNAEVDFTQSMLISPTVSIKITKFSSVTVDTTGKINTAILSQNYSYPLADVKEFVKAIDFNKAGLNLKLKNGLPADLKLNLISTALTINETAVFPKNAADLLPKQILATTSGTPPVYKLDLAAIPNLDLKLNVDIGIKPDGYLTLVDVPAGKVFELYGSADIIMDWLQADFLLPADYSGSKGSIPDTGTDPLDLSKLREYFPPEIKFSPITMYAYASSAVFEKLNEGLPTTKKLKISGFVKAEYIPAGANTKTDTFLIGAAPGTRVPLNFVQKPNLAVSLDGKTFTGTLPVLPAEFSAKNTAAADIINAAPKNLTFIYDMQLGGENGLISVKKTDLESLTSVDVDITCLLLIPLSFTANGTVTGADGTKYAEMNLTPLIPGSDEVPKKDFFSRSKATTNSEGTGDQIANSVKTVELKSGYTNNTGFAANFVLRSGEKDAAGKYPFEKMLSVKHGEGNFSLDLSEAEVKYILGTYPFSPEMLLQIPNGNFGLKKTSTIKLSLEGTIKTDVSVSFPIGGNK